MNISGCPRLESAERFLRQKEFLRARLELAEINLTELTDGERAHVQLLMAEIGLHTGDYKIQHLLGPALNYYKYSPDTRGYAKAKYLEGLLLTAQGDHFEAREVLLESYVHYKRCDMVGEQAGVLNRLGFLSIHLGDVETAIRHLQTCIALYNHLGDESGATIVSMNLASVCYSVGSLSMAVNIFKGIFTSLLTQDARSKAIYFSNYSIPYALRGDFRTARETIAKAVPYLKDYVREQAIYYENLGWIHLLEEEYVNAEKALLDGLAISLRIAPQSALVSQIKRRLADAYLGQGKYDLARQNADEALIVAEKIGERVEIAACYVVYGQLATIDGQKSTARQWFAKALDIYSMTGSRYELASTRYQAAASGIYQNGEQKALLYLARDYFVSEEVSHYVRKVDRELKKLPPGRPAPRPTAVTTFCRLTDIFYLTDPMILGKIRPRRGKEGTGTTCPDSAYLQD